MTTWKSVDEVLNFAMEKEQEAADFYTDLAGRMQKPWMADLFRGFARQEMGHKAKLAEVKQGRRLLPSEQKVANLKIAEYTVDVASAPNMSFQDALILAMKREKAAFKLYIDLSLSTEDEGLKGAFQALAQEEAKHKLHIEVEYDNLILSEN